MASPDQVGNCTPRTSHGFIPLSTLTLLPTLEDSQTVPPDLDYFSLPRKKTPSGPSPIAVHYESHGFIPLCTVDAVEKDNEAEDYFSKPVTQQSPQDERTLESPRTSDKSATSNTLTPRFATSSSSSHQLIYQLTHPTGSPILDRDMPDEFSTDGSQNSGSKSVAFGRKMFDDSEKLWSAESRQKVVAKPRGGGVDKNGLWAPLTIPPFEPVVHLRGGGMDESVEFSAMPVPVGLSSLDVGSALDTVEENDRLFEDVLSRLENAALSATLTEHLSPEENNDSAAYTRSDDASDKRSLCSSLVSSHSRSISSSDGDNTRIRKGHNFSQPFSQEQCMDSAIDDTVGISVVMQNAVAQSALSSNDIDRQIMHPALRYDVCTSAGLSAKVSCSNYMEDKVCRTKPTGLRNRGEPEGRHTKFAAEAFQHGIISDGPVTLKEILAEGSRGQQSGALDMIAPEAATAPLDRSNMLRPATTSYNTPMVHHPPQQLRRVAGRERISTLMDPSEDATLYKLTLKSSARKLASCLQGRTLAIVNASTKDIYVSKVPERMLVHFCGAEIVQKLLSKDSGLPDILEIPASEAEAFSIIRIVRFMRRCCLPSTHQSSGELRIPPDLREGIETIRACRVLGLAADEARIESVIVRDWMGSKTYVMDAATIALVWNGCYGQLRERSLGDAVVWHVLNEVARDVHGSAEDMRWLLEQDEFETLRARVKREVVAKKWREESRTEFLARCKESRDRIEIKKAQKEFENLGVAQRVEETRQRNPRALEQTQAELAAQRYTLWVPPSSWSYAEPATSNTSHVALRANENEEQAMVAKPQRLTADKVQRGSLPDLRKPLPAPPALSYWLREIEPKDTWSASLGYHPQGAHTNTPRSSSTGVQSGGSTQLRQQLAMSSLRRGYHRYDTTGSLSPASSNAAADAVAPKPDASPAAKPRKRRSFWEQLVQLTT